MMYLTPTIARGRRLREGEEPGGATGGGDNAGPAGGNSGGGATGEGESNNSGEAFDAAAFWGGSNGDGSEGESGDSSNNPGGDGSGSSDGQSLQEVLTGRLESMTFGDPVFTADIAEEMNAGNFEGVQNRIDAQLRNATRQSLGLVVSILKPFAEQLTSQMREEMSQTFSNRDNNDSLEKLFPAAKNPAVRPMIQGIYSQALKNTKGNREEAVSQTKQMLKFAAGVTAEDLNININPRGPDDSGPAPKTNWLDELTGR
jgi:hypothetical protein